MDFSSSSDGWLMQRFRAGDREAFAEIYRRRHAALFRFGLGMTADRGKAGELTQDVFVWLIHHAAQFDPARGDLGAFLAGVARKLLYHRERDERRWLPLAETAEAAGGQADEADAGGVDTEALRLAIARLPDHYREAVVLCDLESRSYEEAAELLGCAVGTVRSRLHRARELLARKLRPKVGPKNEIGRACR
ncbi:MAG TPA: sigma-70 family RNA polymerase sigma factor [Bryobacteraceae bacterium]|nr:sigma-70 family RNA polymerase sigma factor [Bryobacteraceae bacterium]